MAPKSEVSIDSYLQSLWKQVTQVVLNYVTFRYWWLVAAICFPMCLAVLLSAGNSNQRGGANANPVLLMNIGTPLMFLVMFLVGQVKSQFAHSRARLVPDFMPAHLLVLVAMLLSIFGFYPLLVAGVANISPLGLFAFTLALGAPAIWGAQLNRFSFTLISLAVFFSMFAERGRQFWVVDATNYSNVHALIVAIGTLALIGWLWRLSCLTEEMDDYQNIFQAALARRTGSEAIEQRRIVASAVRRNWLASHVGDRWHGRLGGYYGGSQAGLVRLLRYGFGSAPAVMQGIFVTAMALCMGIFFTKSSILSQKGGLPGGVLFAAQLAILIPGQIAGQLMVQRRPRIANEMLLPISRRQLIDGLLTASAYNSITLWMMMHIAMGIVATMTNQPLDFRAVAMFLLLSSTTTMASLGISLRTAVWPSLAKRMFVLWLSLMGLMPPIVVWTLTRKNVGDAPFIAIAFVLIGIGIMSIRSARRAWLNLEMV